MKNPTSYLRYRDYVKDCLKLGIEPMSRQDWNYACMKETYDD
tara:strand:+ start:482 stop:607 length:126 start_codon:yes stop_codon:yes gene_type:complete